MLHRPHVAPQQTQRSHSLPHSRVNAAWQGKSERPTRQCLRCGATPQNRVRRRRWPPELTAGLTAWRCSRYGPVLHPPTASEGRPVAARASALSRHALHHNASAPMNFSGLNGPDPMRRLPAILLLLAPVPTVLAGGCDPGFGFDRKLATAGSVFLARVDHVSGNQARARPTVTRDQGFEPERRPAVSGDGSRDQLRGTSRCWRGIAGFRFKPPSAATCHHAAHCLEDRADAR